MIPVRVHAVLDYLTGLLLLVAPYLLGFADGGPAQFVPMAIGGMTILVSLLTDYQLSLKRLIPFPAHLAIDVVSGIFLIVAPWLYGFADAVFLPHLIVGVIYIVVPVLTRRNGFPEPAV